MSEDWKSGRIFINAFKNQLTTPSFVNARKQYNYFSNKYRNGDIIEIKDKSDIVNKIKQCINENNSIKIGDLMYFGNNSGMHHATIISDVTPNMIKFAAHTGPEFNKPLDKSSLGTEVEENNGKEFVHIIRIKF